ncbi:hypothetical protein JCM33374_g5246 [Metschnikowia sp. JCM 33374]|nr:hypothetical protein JCM33374_g5246 [Metschnikowia sp. JCM 33374]
MLRLLVYFLAAFVAIATADTGGCAPSKVGDTGFVARFYSYELSSRAGWSPGFFKSEYKTTLLHTINQLTDFNFHVTAAPRQLVEGEIYGYHTTISNYTIELTGFYRAPASGSFTFKLAADNGGSLQFGAGPVCCNDPLGSVTGNVAVNTLGQAGGADINSDQSTATFTLDQGVYYPIKIVTFNWMGDGGIQLTVTDPSGNTITDFGSQVSQVVFDNGACYATTVTSLWDGSITSTTTEIDAKTNTVVVQIPKSVTTTTTTWMNDNTSTSTVIGDLTNTIVIAVPTPATTVTSTWTGSFTTTTTVTGAPGASNTIIVQEPAPTGAKDHIGCSPSTIGDTGFVARFYSYELSSRAGWSPGFFKSEYKTTLLHTINQLTDFNFHVTAAPRQLVEGDIYGYHTTISNYTIELTGFYRAPASGSFTFKLAADNGGSLQFGAGPVCCNDPLGSVTGNVAVNTLGQAGGADINSDQSTATFTLDQGVYYPIKIVTFNWMGDGGIQLTVTDPSGNTINNFGSQVSQVKFDNGLVCCIPLSPPSGMVLSLPPQLKLKQKLIHTTVTSIWTGSNTQTLTQTNGDTNTIIIQVPNSIHTTTSTWTGSYTTTETVTGGDGSQTPVVIVPYTTSTWTGSYTTTETVTGTDGSKTPIVVVPQIVSTSTWTGSYTTTETVTGADGSKTPVVVVPQIVSTSTWTGSYTTTETVTGADGSKTPVVIVPYTTSTWTGSYTTTETVTGTDGSKTPVVVVPQIVSTSTWTGSYTTTETVTGADGSKTPVVVVPEIVSTSTWTGSYTTTETVTGTDGAQTPVVFVPFSTSTWTGSYTTTETVTGTDGSKTPVVVVPQIVSTSTWTGSYTTTETVTGADGSKTPVVIVPYTTSTWTGSYTTTQTVTGTDGSKTPVVVVPQIVSTSTWTGSYTTTETVTGTDGAQTPVVFVPFSTSTWTGSYTTTETVTGTDGSKTPVVVVPQIVSTSTWTGSYTTTETVTGADGSKTPVVIVQIVSTSTWTGSYTTTETVTGADGSKTPCCHAAFPFPTFHLDWILHHY